MNTQAGIADWRSQMKPYQGQEPYVFISYSHRNMNPAMAVVERLQRDGYRVWYDEGIDPGTEWDDTIATHVEQCAFFIALLSKEYLASSNCKDELNYARDLEKPRVLVYLEDIRLPGAMQMRHGRLQAIHQYRYIDQNQFYEKLYSTKGLELCQGAAPKSLNKTEAAPLTPSAQSAGASEHPANLPDKTVEKYRKAAEQGDAKAQNRLGNCYYYGRGVSQDYSEAVKWYRKAADQGYAWGQYNLGYCYEKGQGVAQDFAEAVKWFQKAADQGHANAQHGLGEFFYYGLGVTQDYSEAVKWYRKAADQGHANAQHGLGYCFYYGRGVSQDYSEAVKWFRKAAEQDLASAQYNLGLCYKKGQGVTQDMTEAEKWYRKAADQGNKSASEALQRLLAQGD